MSSEQPQSQADVAERDSVPLLSVRNLERIYRLGQQTIHALQPLDLDIHKGDFIAIAGPSGSGKSTLLQLLGLVDSPTAGEVRVRDRAAQDLDNEQRAALRLGTLGFVFQAFNLLQMLTAKQKRRDRPGPGRRSTPQTAQACRRVAVGGRAGQTA